jgi:GMP synthase (glutamine-hydrolysing)
VATSITEAAGQKFLRPTNTGILVLDYGSQYTLLIARRLREIGIYAEIIDGRAAEPPKGFDFLGIILSGGPDSVGEDGARKLPTWVLTSRKPVLGICYGLQLLAHELGGRVRSGTKREYGRAEMLIAGEVPGSAGKVFHGLPTRQTVWMSHGDDVSELPAGMIPVARTSDGVMAAVVHLERPIAGLQFHPEVEHTQFGSQMLRSFVTEVCRAPLNWDSGDMIRGAVASVQATVGDAGHVLVACSGGVDSTVAAALLLKALGPERVTAVFCDTGLMRKDEVAWVAENLRVLGLKHLEVLRSAPAFFAALKGVVDPEEKRKRIGRLFIEEFERYAKSHTAEFTHLGQGTLYPDVIESAGHGAGAKVIKSHHNVGGLPDKLHLKLVEPLRFNFKDEVRIIGKALGLPDVLVDRHPFPGPGLGVRILGEVTEERARILQEADHVFISNLREADLYDKVWQAFVVLLPVKSVGVMGDNRTYQNTAAIRAVTSTDGMTADVGDLPMEFLVKTADQIVRKVPGINRVVYDITSKPPATIEWE